MCPIVRFRGLVSGMPSTALKIGQMVATGDWSGLAAMAGFGLLVGVLAVPFLGGGAMISAGLIVVLRQIVGWLYTGNWPPMEFRAAWHAVGGTEPDLPGLRGVQKILAWFLDQPLSVSLAVYGAIVIVLGLVIMIKVEGRFPRKMGTGDFET
jgi:hypothetical protein